jgi:uncharacterized protein (DUF983 family)
MFPSRFRKAPLITSFIAVLVLLICFHFIDLGIAATAQYQEEVAAYSELLVWGKWLIVAGLLVRGVVKGLNNV